MAHFKASRKGQCPSRQSRLHSKPYDCTAQAWEAGSYGAVGQLNVNTCETLSKHAPMWWRALLLH